MARAFWPAFPASGAKRRLRALPLQLAGVVLAQAANRPRSRSIGNGASPRTPLRRRGLRPLRLPGDDGGRRRVAEVSGITAGYTIVYTVRDGAGASASVIFTATVRPPASVPPLSLPGIPNSRVPSGGVVNTLCPAATAGRAPYEYSLFGLPPGITFSPSTRVASGTLPTVTTDTTYPITYSVRDSRGATDSTSFSATVTARRVVFGGPPGPPPTEDPTPVPAPSTPVLIPILGLPFTVSETGEGEKTYYFRLDSRTDVSVSLTGMNRDINCRVNGSSCTNRAGTSADSWIGTLDAGTHSVTVYPYNADAGSWTLRASGTATSPPPTEDPDPPPPVTVVRVVRVYSLPFTESETGEGEKSYRFSLDSRTDVSVSLTGMNRDIDCRVNSSSCTNGGGTRDDSWSGTLDAGTHSVTVYPYNADAGSWTVSVSGTATSPPTPTPSPPTTDSGPIVKRGVNVSSSRTYLLRLSGTVEVSVELTGMTTDFDCTVSGNWCTNRGGTADDSWSGTLDAGEHEIVVYPYGGGSGNYTLTVSAEAPETGGSTGTRTQVTTLVDVSRTGVSASQAHSFTLSGPAEVDVALTGLTIDFNCRVGSSNCTNRWGTLDDSWNGNLGEGDHSVVVYPYDPGPGNYSLTVTATETLNSVATPLGGGPIRLRVCEKDSTAPGTDVVLPGSCVEVVIPRGGGDDDGDGDGGPPPPPPPPGGNSQGNSRDLDGDGVVDDYLAVVAETTACSDNLSPGQRFGAHRPGGGTHSGVDIDVADGSEFFAFKGGELTNGYNPRCGNYVDIVHDGGGSRVCHLDPNNLVPDGRVEAGGLIGRWGGTGTHSGGAHLHLSYRDANGVRKPYYEDTDGEPTLNDDGC